MMMERRRGWRLEGGVERGTWRQSKADEACCSAFDLNSDMHR